MVPPESKSTPFFDSGQVIYTPANAGEKTWVAGDTYRVLASREDGAGIIGIAEGFVSAGAGPSPHIHEYTDESIFLINGMLELRIDDKVISAETGAFLHIPRGTVHRFTNTGEEEARLILIFNPAGPELFHLHAGDIPEPGRKPAAWSPERVRKALAAVAHLNVDTIPYERGSTSSEPRRQMMEQPWSDTRRNSSPGTGVNAAGALHHGGTSAWEQIALGQGPAHSEQQPRHLS